MTTRPPRRHAKAETLRAHGALHPRPAEVRDPLFGSHEFFDARDLVQVKYEMLRRVDVDHQPITQTADAFGCSRPTFYQAQAAFKAQGPPRLGAPQARAARRAQAGRRRDGLCGYGPHRGAYGQRAGTARPHSASLWARDPPSLPRAGVTDARKKTTLNTASVAMMAPSTPVLVTSYEALRRVALGQSGPTMVPVSASRSCSVKA